MPSSRPTTRVVPPVAKSTRRRADTRAAVAPKRRPKLGLLEPQELGDTKSKILDATFRCLATEGYAALSVREIAKAAGVNPALVNYHFGTKEQLVLEVLDAANARLLARQKAMYRGSQGFAEKWAEARRFYESDLASGFVRVQAELMAAGYSSPWLRERVAARVLAWGELVHASVCEAFTELAAQGIQLPMPLTPGVVSNWICHFWIGMEVGDLLGGWSPPGRSNTAALDAVQKLLEALDAHRGHRNGNPKRARNAIGVAITRKGRP